MTCPLDIGRTLIPRYFRSIFESGCNELYFTLRHTRESFHNSMLTLESDCASMVMNMARPFPSTVFVDAQFTLGFTLDELMRIRNWTFQIRSHRELIVRSVLGVQVLCFLSFFLLYFPLKLHFSSSLCVFRIPWYSNRFQKMSPDRVF